MILDVAKEYFPDQWTEITPIPAHIYSWVGYDIDGRTDIKWGDAIRLRLSEKHVQLGRYLDSAVSIQNDGKFDSAGFDAMKSILKLLGDAQNSASEDLSLFKKDLDNTDNLSLIHISEPTRPY